MHEAADWVIVVRNHLAKMFAVQTGPTIMYEDNEVAINFAHTGPGHRSMHWDVNKLQYVTELEKRFKIIDVRKIDTKLQIADVLTKALPIQQHLALSALLLGSPVIFDD